jgi:two-component system, OmpR family, sensor histidine kinase SenX3
MPEAIWVLAAVVAVGLAHLIGRRHAVASSAAPDGDTEPVSADPWAGSAALQDLILETMDDGVLLIGADGATAFANEPIVHLLGARPEGTSALFPAALRQAVRSAADLRQGSSILIETGTPTRWLRVVSAPAGDDGAVLCIVHDETEMRQLDRIRRDFVANASHELKTPAASIQAAAETIREAAHDDPSAVPRFAAQLEREAARLARIVADLLDLSRLESGGGEEEDVALDDVIRDEVERLRGAALGASVSIDAELADAVRVRGSRRDLTLLVRNLIENAVRACHEGGKVLVRLETDGGALLTVADDGVGIPSRDIPRIFERFYRVDRARSRDTGGTGLGLAIVKHVAENHGGSVHVTSELGAGSTFEVRLPWVRAHAEGRSA